MIAENSRFAGVSVLGGVEDVHHFARGHVVKADARIGRGDFPEGTVERAHRLAEEHEKVTSTWYAQDECAALLLAAGFNEVTPGPGAGPAGDGEAFSLVARL